MYSMMGKLNCEKQVKQLTPGKMEEKRDSMHGTE